MVHPSPSVTFWYLDAFGGTTLFIECASATKTQILRLMHKLGALEKPAFVLLENMDQSKLYDH